MAAVEVYSVQNLLLLEGTIEMGTHAFIVIMSQIMVLV